MRAIRRALISVSDKTGLVHFAKALSKRKIEIISTGGTLKTLKTGGIPAIPVERVTGFPEILEGRVKTLHPKIHGGLLYRRDKKSHSTEAKKFGIEAIDLVVVNLYPFEEITRNGAVTLETAIENIDIGGPSMLRSAAKNHEAVAVVCDPADYPEVLQEIKKNDGKISRALRKRLALKVFERTSAYDRAIADFFESRERPRPFPATDVPLPSTVNIAFRKSCDLRYGENPHQRGALYLPSAAKGKMPFEKLHGKELSFNNLLDIEAAMDVMREFPASGEMSAACVIKHSNPSGIAEGASMPEAIHRAIECDAMSAFGGIIGINRPCDLESAQAAFERLRFFEVFVAPGFEPKAVEFMRKRENLRLIATGPLGPGGNLDLRFLQSGLLVQDKDKPLHSAAEKLKHQIRCVTQKKLKPAELNDLFFAFKCVKVVKSNAIVITDGRQTVGIGAGQMSRVDSVEIACRKAGYRTEGGMLASDAFFPMPDSIEAAADHKIRAIIQPGGSLRDGDVVAACDKFGIAMVLTGERHFRH